MQINDEIYGRMNEQIRLSPQVDAASQIIVSFDLHYYFKTRLSDLLRIWFILDKAITQELNYAESSKNFNDANVSRDEK